MRIRSIKPEFWRSDDIDALSIPDRLLFIGLWSYVDDSGVGVDRESSIAADLFAGDLSREPQETAVRVHGGLMRLTEAGLITRYTARGKRWLHISNWTKHQKINRPTESNRPAPTSADAVPHDESSDGSVKSHADSSPGAGEQGSRGVTTSRSADAKRHNDEKFDEFYGVYPRKRDRQDAKRAWDARMREGVDADRLIRAAKSFARQVQGKEPEHIKYPAVWLRKGSYDNEPEQTGLSVVPDLPTCFEEIRDGLAVRRAGELLGRSFVAPSQPPSDQTPPEEWHAQHAAEWIDKNEGGIRAALARKQAV